ncbi:hypothetical protein ACWDV4_17985 [Micromonospora sp. NPDC003197]
MTATTPSKSPVVVDLELVGDVEPEWRDLFAATVRGMTGRLADRELAERTDAFVSTLKLVRYTTAGPAPLSAMFFPNEAEVIFLDAAFDGAGGEFSDTRAYFTWVVIHEAAHIIDHVSSYALSAAFGRAVGSVYETQDGHRRYVPGNPEALRYATTISGSKSVFEDFAESVAMYLSDGVYMQGRFGRVDQARMSTCSALFVPKEKDR